MEGKAVNEMSYPKRPFALMWELPPDMHEAYESFKLSIVRHRLAAWSEVSPDDVAAALDALKSLIEPKDTST